MNGLENRLAYQLEKLLNVYRDSKSAEHLFNSEYVSKTIRDSALLLEEIDRLRRLDQ